jgi:hypothetical protein
MSTKGKHNQPEGDQKTTYYVWSIIGDIVRVMPGVLINLTQVANVGLGFMNKVLTLEIYSKNNKPLRYQISLNVVPSASNTKPANKNQ